MNTDSCAPCFDPVPAQPWRCAPLSVRSPTHPSRPRAVWLRLAAVLVLLPALAGCSAVTAARQPPRKDVRLLRPGTDRDVVFAEFGMPLSSVALEDGGTRELYCFIQGESRKKRLSQTFVNGTADLLTLGLWEVVGPPAEQNYEGRKIVVRVIFDARGKVRELATLSISDV